MDSAAHFADRASSNPRLASNILDRITSTQGPDRTLALLEAVHAVGLSLNNDPRISSYSVDRAAANACNATPMSEAEYQTRYPQAGTPTLPRRTWAAAHALAEECSDDRINAPVWGPGGPSENDLESYRRWTVLVSGGQRVCHPEPSRRQADIDVRQV